MAATPALLKGKVREGFIYTESPSKSYKAFEEITVDVDSVMFKRQWNRVAFEGLSFRIGLNGLEMVVEEEKKEVKPVKETKAEEKARLKAEAEAKAEAEKKAEVPTDAE